MWGKQFVIIHSAQDHISQLFFPNLLLYIFQTERWLKKIFQGLGPCTLYGDIHILADALYLSIEDQHDNICLKSPRQGRQPALMPITKLKLLFDIRHFS